MINLRERSTGVLCPAVYLAVLQILGFVLGRSEYATRVPAESNANENNTSVSHYMH